MALTQVLAILQLALALLTTVASTPSASPEQKRLAVETAAKAVVLAQGVVNTPQKPAASASAVTSSGPAPQPSLTAAIPAPTAQAEATATTPAAPAAPPAPQKLTLIPGSDYYFEGAIPLERLNEGFGISHAPAVRLDELLFFTGIPPAQTDAASATYYRWEGGYWYNFGSGATIFDARITRTTQHFVIRKNPGGTYTEFALPLNGFTFHGSTTINGLPRPWPQPPEQGSGPPPTGGSGGGGAGTVAVEAGNDYYFKGSITLGELRAAGFSASVTPGARSDELLVFAYSPPQSDHSATDTYYWWSNAWRTVGAGGSIIDNSTQASTYFIVRKNTGYPASTLTLPSSVTYFGKTSINGSPRPWQ
jgi:hypothetical protein